MDPNPAGSKVSGSGMDPDPAGSRKSTGYGKDPDPAGSSYLGSGMDPDPAGSENCGSGAPLLPSASNNAQQRSTHAVICPLGVRLLSLM